jgi:hypothetical protein
MEKRFESIYMLMRYEYRRHDIRKIQYPSFNVKAHEFVYFKTMEEVEEYLLSKVEKWNNKVLSMDDNFISDYAYVVLELPMSTEVSVFNLGQNLSVRIYLPDGTLWGIKPYANFFPKYALDDDGYNYWGRLNQFWGRGSEEIKFKQGDIVEIFGYPGNGYWSEDEVNLAIIVKTPPTKEDVAEMKKQYLATHSGFDVCDHALCRVFDYSMDTYEVISFACEEIDHASTISVFKPTKPVSSRRKKVLESLLYRHLNEII